MKIRKTIQIVAAVLSLALLVACSSAFSPARATRQYIDDAHAAYARQAVKICEQYLAFELDRSDAMEMLTEVMTRANATDTDISSLEQAAVFKINKIEREFDDLADDEIRAISDQLRAMYENRYSYSMQHYSGPGEAELCDYGFSPDDVADFQPAGSIGPTGSERIQTGVIIDAFAAFDSQRVRDGIITSITAISAGDKPAMNLVYQIGGETYVSSLFMMSPENGKPIATYTVYHDVNGERRAYLFNAMQKTIDLYKTDDFWHYDDVAVVQDPLTPDQAADFFLACLPE